jgi:hypothetical protein
VCPLVAGLSRGEGEAVLLRISDIARSAGIEVGKEQCKVNLFVVFTSDPVLFMSVWRKRDTNLFGGASRITINRFLDSGDPVRAWYNASHIAADGRPRRASGAYFLSRDPTLQESGCGGLPNSRLVTTCVWALDSVIVMVDTGKASSRRLGQVADYAALIGLAQLRANGDLAAIPTILNLFDDVASDHRAIELTEWDRTLLGGLYATEQTYLLQRSQVRQYMLRELVPDAAAGTATAAQPE